MNALRRAGDEGPLICRRRRFCALSLLGASVLVGGQSALAATGSNPGSSPASAAVPANPYALDAPSDPAPSGSLPLLAAEDGVTALAGRVLDVDGTPLWGVTVADDAARGQTDAQGRFLLRGVRPGWGVLVINGHQAVPMPAGSDGNGGMPLDHGYYEARVVVTAGQTTQLPWTSWLPRIDHAHEVAIASPTTEAVVVHAATVPGLELHIPKGAVITDPEGQLVHAVGITPIPVKRPPFPLPVGVRVAMNLPRMRGHLM